MEGLRIELAGEVDDLLLGESRGAQEIFLPDFVVVPITRFGHRPAPCLGTIALTRPAPSPRLAPCHATNACKTVRSIRTGAATPCAFATRMRRATSTTSRSAPTWRPPVSPSCATWG